MDPLVIDASTTMGFLLRDEQPELAMKVLSAIEKGAELHVPAHWAVEVANGLLMAERRERASQADVMEAHELLSQLGAIIDDQTTERAGRDSLALARQYGLTIYDAAYLELAIRLKAGLATNDKALAKAAIVAGVAVFT